jgi:hypothetical protein
MIRSPLFHACLWVVAVGCRHIFDINEAELDPGVASTGGSSSSSSVSDANGGSESASGGTGAATAHAGANSASEGGESGAAASGGGGAAGEGSGDPPPPPPLCETYCATISANCSGDLAQYPDLDTCLAVCDALPESGWDNSGSNTVQCRLAQAQKATGDAASYACAQAGPSGGGECGWDCDAYCAVMAAFCTSESTGGLAYYSSTGACKQECKDVPEDDDPYSVSLHSTGPHLQCRLVHACAAAGDPVNECAAALGGPPCDTTE